MANRKIEYFAAMDSKETASDLLARSVAQHTSGLSDNFSDKMRKSWNFYYGIFNEDGQNHKLSFTGDQGELVRFPINHYANIAKHLLNMTLSNRPAFQARATNTDYKSLSQTILANGLLDYYLREMKLEEYLKKAVEQAIIFGEGYIKIEWDGTAGNVYDYDVNEETGTKIPVYEGNVRYTNISYKDVTRDPSKESTDYDWLMVRSYKNRFSLMAKYPELADEISKVDSKDDLGPNRGSIYNQPKTDDIPVYEFFHVKNDALPDGRYLLFVSPEAILYDGPLPYPEIPVYRMSPSDIMGTPYGYTIMFDLLPIQEAINMIYSTILTNQNAFGVQNLLVPKGSDFNYSQLQGGLNIIEFLPQVGKPEALNLTLNAPELFKNLEQLERVMETISGINSVTRGQPEASLKSGAALALIQAQAVQFASMLQHSYTKLVENIGTATIKTLQLYAKVPRIAAIAGKSNKSYLKEFKGDDISNISHVTVEIANPLSRTTAGRSEIANNLLQMKLITNVEQYFTVLNTGQLDTLIEGQQAELMLIRAENEDMMVGKMTPSIVLDNHKLHIQEHKALLADPALRRNPELVQLVLNHVQTHIDLLSGGSDPRMLLVTNQEPLPPPPPPMLPGPPPGPPEGSLEAPTPTNVKQAGPGLVDVLQQPQGGVEEAQNIALPNIPVPPPPFSNMPTDPSQA